jgi:hypothetical protein
MAGSLRALRGREVHFVAAREAQPQAYSPAYCILSRGILGSTGAGVFVSAKEIFAKAGLFKN